MNSSASLMDQLDQEKENPKSKYQHYIDKNVNKIAIFK